ncbi:MAG TPA: hypothetical protein VMW64_09235 [Dehalococcoidia bacterium]|nr:hypothetical protein [Dehalococcoidia bacterium]
MSNKEVKEVKVNLSFTSEKLFLYGAILDAVVGFLWAILAAATDSQGAYKAAGFFQGFFFAVLGGLVLYGLYLILQRKQ